ncbi:MAG: hypothetical protein Q7K55_05285 [Candidatus Levybacteria bacterium]|nr:hypothetical protein [Candidatus Levybacteria bacterium]
MKRQRLNLKSDMYRKTRGGYSRFLNIYCSNCKNHILLYQKDGPGPLKRLYLDRIFAPSNLTLFYSTKNIKKIPNLVCPDCHSQIGTPYKYPKEKRLAFLISPTSFIKTIGKGIYPPENLRIE